MRSLRALVLATALLAPFGGSAAATSCSPDIGALSCPVQASASVWGTVDYCTEMVGATGWRCELIWYESFSGAGIAPGTVTISEYGSPVGAAAGG